MKINFKVKLVVFGEDALDHEGNPIYLNKLLANLLGSNPHKDTGIGFMDAITWATAINKGEEIDLERSEQDALRKFIESDPNLTAFAKGCLIEVLKQ